MTDHDHIVRLLKPWYPCFAGLVPAIERSVLEVVPVLGIPKMVERAGDYHRAWRKWLRAWTEEVRHISNPNAPLYSLVEEPDGQGLDFLICRLDENTPFVIRIGRCKNGRIRRNNTHRQAGAARHGVLSSEYLFDMEASPDEMPHVTLAHTIENNHTEAGRPCWYTERLLLGVEEPDGYHILDELARWTAPVSVASDPLRSPEVKPLPDQLAEWRKQIYAASRLAG